MTTCDPSAPRPGAAAGLGGLLRAALWPAVALAALLCVAAPLRALLGGAADRLRAEQAIDLGGDFRVVLRDAGLRPPPGTVAQAIAQLDEALFRTLIDHPEGGHPVCRDSTDPADIRVKSRYDALVRIGLAEYRAFEGHQGWCDSRIDLVYLTDLGRASRQYFEALLLDMVRVTR